MGMMQVDVERMAMGVGPVMVTMAVGGGTFPPFVFVLMVGVMDVHMVVVYGVVVVFDFHGVRVWPQDKAKQPSGHPQSCTPQRPMRAGHPPGHPRERVGHKRRQGEQQQRPGAQHCLNYDALLRI